MLDAKRLKIFCVVAEEGSFTAAAVRLCLTQSAVSQQVAILERDVGAPLLKRLPRGVETTELGKVLKERAQSVLRELLALEQDMHRIAAPPTKATLGVFSTAGAYLVPAVVQRYRQSFPGVQLIVHESQPEDLAKELADGTIDVGLTWDYDFLPRPIEALRLRHLLDDPLCLLLPVSHPLAQERGPLRLGELAEEAWVVREHKSPPYLRAFEDMCRLAGFEPNIVFRTEDYQSVQGLVAAGVGAAVAPRLSLTAQRNDIVVREIREPAFMRRIGAVALPDVNESRLAWGLLELLTELWRRPDSGDAQG